MKISLIEDEPDCYEPYADLLRSRDHEVRIYTDADEAVAGLRQIVNDDVVILDLMIQLGTQIKPDEGSETGIAIYRRIRKIAPGVPIVVVTARLKREVWSDFEGDPKVRFLSKPVNSLEVFFKTIEGAAQL